MSLTKQDLADIRTVVVDAINESFELLSVPRFDAIETKLDNLEVRVSNLEAKIAGLEYRMTSLETYTAKIETRLDSIETRLETIEGEIITLKNDVLALYKLSSKPILPSFDTRFEKLTNEAKLQTLHRYVRKLAKQLNIQL